MTTNGIALRRKLQPLKQAGLDVVNISLDTLDPHKFVLMTRRQGMDHVVKAINEATQLEFSQVKINCVVMKGVNDMEVTKFAKFTQSDPVDVRFIEYMPFGGKVSK